MDFEALRQETKLIRWLCGRDYLKRLRDILNQGSQKELLEVYKCAKGYFPFLNRGYFGGYDDVKKMSEDLFGVPVNETDLPPSLLGAYIPSEEKSRRMIIINKASDPFFRLSTLAHEMSHIVVCNYLKKTHPDPQDIRVRNRVAEFAESLKDKEELLADALTALSAYPYPDFQKAFAGGGFGWRAVFRAVMHLRRHYPEIVRGFFKSRRPLLNIAFIIHFFRLRRDLYERFAL